MQIKRFEEKNMTEALRAIKKEFGPEAVILSARSLKKERGMLGKPKNVGVEVTAAIDNISLSDKKGLKQHLWVPQRAEFALKKQSDFSGKSKSSIFLEGVSDRVTLANNRRQPKISRNEIPHNIERLFSLHHQFLLQGVEEEISLDLIARINRFVVNEEIFNSDPLKQCMAEILKEMGIKEERVKFKSEKQKIVAFVGPTGVGKTTTLAKLAAAAKIGSRKKRVGLITLDNYRIAAVEQLRIYSKIFGMPIEVALSNKELKKSIKKLSDNDLILIDTGGVNPLNENQIQELSRCFQKIPSVEIHLLLSATTKEATLNETLKRLQAIPIKRLIFTKLDECTTYGSILNLLVRSKIPVSYFTNGQQVPDEIEAATIERLLDRLLMQSAPSEAWNGSPEHLADHMTMFERMINAVDAQIEVSADSMDVADIKTRALS